MRHEMRLTPDVKAALLNFARHPIVRASTPEPDGLFPRVPRKGRQEGQKELGSDSAISNAEKKASEAGEREIEKREGYGNTIGDYARLGNNRPEKTNAPEVRVPARYASLDGAASRQVEAEADPDR